MWLSWKQAAISPHYTCEITLEVTEMETGSSNESFYCSPQMPLMNDNGLTILLVHE